MRVPNKKDWYVFTYNKETVTLKHRKEEQKEKKLKLNWVILDLMKEANRRSRYNLEKQIQNIFKNPDLKQSEYY